MTTQSTARQVLYCPNCDEDRQFSHQVRTETHRIRDEEITTELPSFVCPVCGDGQPDPQQDPMLLLFAEYRRRRGLLDPTDIKRIREHYGLSRESFASLLGMSPATLYRYEAGSLQDEVHDNLIRACDEPREMIGIFNRHRQRLSELQQRRFRDAVGQLPEQARPKTWTEQRLQPDQYGGWRLFSYSRFVVMIRCFCDVTGGVFQTKLFKLLFFADFLACKKLGQSISGSPYRAIQHGPVPADYDALMKRMVEEDHVSVEEVDFREVSGIRYMSGPKSPPNGASLNQEEIRIIHAVADRFHSMTAKEIRAASHEEVAWKRTPQKELVSYELAKHLSFDT